MLGSRKLITDASATITSVLGIRTKGLEEDNPFTLLAMVTAAIVKGALGRLEEAEDVLIQARNIATESFDDQNHIGILFGLHTLASVYVQQRGRMDAKNISA